VSAGAFLPPPRRERATLRDLLASRRIERGLARREAEGAWRLVTFRGRLSEISSGRASAALTLATQLVLDAQRLGEPVAWIAPGSSTFYPPDVAAAGVDLAALVVVRARETTGAARAAERLLRSGAFGLVVLDLGARAPLTLAAQTRLAGLAQRHDAAVLCLTEKEGDRPSQGSLVSLRADALRREREGEGYRCEARALKDKRRPPGWTHREVFRAPDGLR
jgi:recombination protein RecA